jgi:HAD superfamily hydrolase (TIGR01450 family)
MATYPDLLSLAPELESAEGILIDLDGTLMTGGRLLPGAASFLSDLHRPHVILSNDTEHTAHQLARMFLREGIPLTADQFVLAGVALVEELAAAEPGASVLMLGSLRLQRLARSRGLRLTSDNPAVVLVMRDRRFTYQRLAAAARAVHGGARLIVACPDMAHPGPAGEPVPESGALAAALLACTGPIEYRVFGKPDPEIFRLAAARMGLAPSRCAMVGDNPATDGAGALLAGMTFHQVARPGASLPAGGPRQHVVELGA